MSISSDHRRCEIRRPIQGEAWVEVHAEEPGIHNRNAHLICTVMEVSPQGLRLAGIANEIEVGSILKVLIRIPDTSRQYLLTGIARWCRQYEGELQFQVGWQLYDAMHTDIENWKQFCGELTQLQ